MKDRGIKKWVLGNEGNALRSSVIWNIIGGGLIAGQNAILLVFISYCMDMTEAGMVTIAYAVANIFTSVAKYGVRDYQVTDIRENYSFSEYFYCRCLTGLGTLLLAVLYILYCRVCNGYSDIKCIIFCEMIILKLIDAFEDVYIGRYQQIGRFDIGSRILAIRMLMSTALMCIFIVMGSGMCVSLLAGIISSIVIDVVLIGLTVDRVDLKVPKSKFGSVGELLKKCFPLCIGITLSVYIGNVPKYTIDAYMSEDIQAIFGYIMLPVFVVTLLNQFIYQPVIKELGDAWVSGDKEGFVGKIRKQCLAVAGLTIVMVIAGIPIGLPLLSVIYNVELTTYDREFAVLLIGGAFYALAYYLNVCLTTIRRQRFVAIGYVAAVVLSLLLGRRLVQYRGMMGAAWLYLVVNAVPVVFYSIVLAVTVRTTSTEINGNI